MSPHTLYSTYLCLNIISIKTHLIETYIYIYMDVRCEGFLWSDGVLVMCPSSVREHMSCSMKTHVRLNKQQAVVIDFLTGHTKSEIYSVHHLEHGDVAPASCALLSHDSRGRHQTAELMNKLMCCV